MTMQGRQPWSRVRRSDAPQDLLALDRDTSAVPTARAWLAEFLRDHDIHGAICDDATLIASEMVTNALRHGTGGVVIRVALTPGREIRLAVTDSGDGMPQVQPKDPSRVGGLGLRIVEEIADDWGVSKFPGGTTVWAVLGLDR
jgi:anti-sigma regulatory factor (Ser/Thr protein kinase)